MRLRCQAPMPVPRHRSRSCQRPRRSHECVSVAYHSHRVRECFRPMISCGSHFYSLTNPTLCSNAQMSRIVPSEIPGAAMSLPRRRHDSEAETENAAERPSAAIPNIATTAAATSAPESGITALLLRELGRLSAPSGRECSPRNTGKIAAASCYVGAGRDKTPWSAD